MEKFAFFALGCLILIGIVFFVANFIAKLEKYSEVLPHDKNIKIINKMIKNPAVIDKYRINKIIETSPNNPITGISSIDDKDRAGLVRRILIDYFNKKEFKIGTFRNYRWGVDLTSKRIEKISKDEAIEVFSLCLLSTEFTDDGNFGNTLMDIHVVRKLVLDVYVCYKTTGYDSATTITYKDYADNSYKSSVSDNSNNAVYKDYDLETNIELIEVVTGGDILLNGV